MAGFGTHFGYPLAPEIGPFGGNIHEPNPLVFGESQENTQDSTVMPVAQAEAEQGLIRQNMVSQERRAGAHFRARFDAATTPRTYPEIFAPVEEKLAIGIAVRQDLLNHYRKYIPAESMVQFDDGRIDPIKYDLCSPSNGYLMAIKDKNNGDMILLARHELTNDPAFGLSAYENLPVFTSGEYNAFAAAELEYVYRYLITVALDGPPAKSHQITGLFVVP